MGNYSDNSGCLEALVSLVLVLVFYVTFAAILSLPVMWLWNWLMPYLFGLKAITWGQALGLSLLCNFLFKGTSVNTNKKN